MKSLLVSTRPDDIVMWAAMTTGHFLLLRSGEFVLHKLSDFNSNTHLTCNDVRFLYTPDGNEYMTFHIKKSKTDQAGRAWNYSLHWSLQT